MGWQDAPVVGGQSSDQSGGKQPAWMNAPLVTPPSPNPAAPAAASQQDLGTTALWNKPADTSWNDYLMAHLAKPFQGADQAAQDYSRTAVDAATFGLGDRFQSYLTGNPLDKERAATAASSGRLGAMAPIVQGAMYAMGPGEVGAASKIGEAAAPWLGGGKVAQWTGGVLGSAAEGAGAGAAGAAGHDESIGQGALVGGALGAAGGVPGGVVGRGGALAPATSAADLKAQAQQAYAPLSNVIYDATKEVHPALDVTDAQNALRDWSGYKWGDASKTSGEIKTLLDKPQLSANDLQQSQSYLKGIARNPNSDPNDALYASHYVGKLQDVLENGVPQTGVPAGAGPGYAAQVKAVGDALHGKAQDVERLNDWIAKGAVAGGPDVGGQASAYLRSKPGQTFAPPGTPAYDAINTLAKTNAGPDLSAAPGAWDIRHGVHPLVSALAAGAITGAGGQIASGHYDPASLAAEAAIGAATGYGLHKGVPWAQKTFVQGPAQQRAIAAARSALSTGLPQAPVLPPAPLRDVIRNLIYGQGAGGAY
jgi:hypothetical protein